MAKWEEFQRVDQLRKERIRAFKEKCRVRAEEKVAVAREKRERYFQRNRELASKKREALEMQLDSELLIRSLTKNTPDA